MTKEGKAIDQLYKELDRLKGKSTEMQAGVITDYQDYILGNYAQIRSREAVLREYLEQISLK